MIKPTVQRYFSIGIIGAGEITAKHHLPVLGAFPDIKIEYITDISRPRLDSIADAYGLNVFPLPADLEVLPPTDGVLVAIPVGYRGPYYRLFADRHTAVFAEKPIALSAKQGEQLFGQFPEHALACGFQRRTFASVDIARTAIEQKWFGPIRSVNIEEGARTGSTGADSVFHDSWMAAEGGILRDLGCHALDTLFHISGATSAEVLLSKFVFDGKIDRELRANLHFSGPEVSFETDLFLSWLRQTSNHTELRFDSCALRLSTRPDDRAILLDRDGQESRIYLTSTRRCARTVNQAFYLEWKYFLESISTGTPGRMNGASCLPVLKAVDDLYSAGLRSG